jgi:ketosteroid isomerase-like protein
MSRENVELVRQGFQAFLREDWEQIVGGLDPSVEVIEPPGVVGSRVYYGREGFVKAMKAWPSQWDDFRAELVKVIDANDEQVVWLTRHHGRGKGSGIEIEGEIAYVTTFRDGMVVRWEMFWSLTDALEAARLSE